METTEGSPDGLLVKKPPPVEVLPPMDATPMTKGFPDLRGAKFSFAYWLGMSVNVNCQVCCLPMTEFVWYPVTGRCGHTVCGLCFRKCDANAKDAIWSCPVKGCIDEKSFQTDRTGKNWSMACAIVKWEDIEYTTGLHIKRANADYVNDILKCRSQLANMETKHRDERGHVIGLLKAMHCKITEMRANSDSVPQKLSKEDLELDRAVKKVIDCHKEVNTFVMPTDQSAPIKAMEKRVQTIQNKLQNLEEKTRNCPRCNDSMTLDEYPRLSRKSSSESWSTESEQSSWSSNRSCLEEGYDNKNLPGWNPDPFANFVWQYPKLTEKPFTGRVSPRYRNSYIKKTRKKRVAKGSKSVDKIDNDSTTATQSCKKVNTWTQFLNNLEEKNGGDDCTTTRKRKSKSDVASVAGHALDKKKAPLPPRVSLEGQACITTRKRKCRTNAPSVPTKLSSVPRVSLTRSKSTSEEEF